MDPEPKERRSSPSFSPPPLSPPSSLLPSPLFTLSSTMPEYRVMTDTLISGYLSYWDVGKVEKWTVRSSLLYELPTIAFLLFFRLFLRLARFSILHSLHFLFTIAPPLLFYPIYSLQILSLSQNLIRKSSSPPFNLSDLILSFICFLVPSISLL